MAAPARWIAPLLAIVTLLGGGWALQASRRDASTATATAAAAAASGGSRAPVVVEVAVVERGALDRRRDFTGTLETKREITVAAKVSGRLERITVELGDTVRRGQVVAELDDAELVQASAQARAELGVARARKTAADNALQIAARNLERVTGLRRRGVISEQEFDTTRAAKLQAEAAAQVAASEVTRARAALRGAEVREGYARVSVDWSDGVQERVVAARLVDDGTVIAANTPLMSVVGLDPLIVAIHVTEQDYAQLRAGLPVTLRTDVYPGEAFVGQVARVAPVFSAQSRQARVELEVQNPDGRLRPGMFVRVQIVLERLAEAAIVPRAALVAHEDGQAVYVVDEDDEDDEDDARARLQPVIVTVIVGERAHVQGVEPPARVVTLGQSLLQDGARVVVAGSPEETP